MADSWTTDLLDYLDEEGRMNHLPGRAWSIAHHQAAIVSWASAFPSLGAQRTNVTCRRRPNHVRCPGEIHAGIDTDGDAVRWHCPTCGDNGEIRGWQGTRWDRFSESEDTYLPAFAESAVPGPAEAKRMMRDIQSLLEEENFDSEEEAQTFLDALVGKPLPFMDTDDDDLSIAEDLVIEAMDANTPEEAKALAREALEISPDCCDAYLLLSEVEAHNSESEFSLVEQAVRAGERALGPEIFEDGAGHFWGLIETWPYMRARLRLAELLSIRGESDLAIGHCRDLLRLNPNDNHGVRYALCDYLLEAGNDQEALKLLYQYEDDAAAEWGYSLALALFRTEGESERANTALDEALESNPHVPPFLLGWKSAVGHLAEFVSFGSEEEAAGYGLSGIQQWRATYGAVRWLRQRTPSRISSR